MRNGNNQTRFSFHSVCITIESQGKWFLFVSAFDWVDELKASLFIDNVKLNGWAAWISPNWSTKRHPPIQSKSNVNAKCKPFHRFDLVRTISTRWPLTDDREQNYSVPHSFHCVFVAIWTRWSGKSNIALRWQLLTFVFYEKNPGHLINASVAIWSLVECMIFLILISIIIDHQSTEWVRVMLWCCELL